MEAVVFCGIAGLVAFCVAGLLPSDAVASRPCGFAAGGVDRILLLTGRIFDPVSYTHLTLPTNSRV